MRKTRLQCFLSQAKSNQLYLKPLILIFFFPRPPPPFLNLKTLETVFDFKWVKPLYIYMKGSVIKSITSDIDVLLAKSKGEARPQRDFQCLVSFCSRRNKPVFLSSYPTAASNQIQVSGKPSRILSTGWRLPPTLT